MDKSVLKLWYIRAAIISLAWVCLLARLISILIATGASKGVTLAVLLGAGMPVVLFLGFTKNVTLFMSKNLIAAENVTTPHRQKAGITSIVMHLKTNALSNEIKIHIQKNAHSEKLEKLLIL